MKNIQAYYERVQPYFLLHYSTNFKAIQAVKHT